MFGWFCKKKKEEYKLTPLEKRTKEVIYEEQEFDVGITKVEYLFTDHETIIRSIYGEIHQHVSLGKDEDYDGYCSSMREPFAEPAYITTSQTKAQFEVNNSYIGMTTISDDQLNPTESHTGNVKHKKILSTKEFKKKFSVATVKDKACT